MDIFLYAFSVMYSPGPVNLMGLNAGLTGKLRRSTGFYIGVGSAMLLMFVQFSGETGVQAHQVHRTGAVHDAESVEENVHWNLP